MYPLWAVSTSAPSFAVSDAASLAVLAVLLMRWLPPAHDRHVGTGSMCTMEDSQADNTWHLHGFCWQTAWHKNNGGQQQIAHWQFCQVWLLGPYLASFSLSPNLETDAVVSSQQSWQILNSSTHWQTYYVPFLLIRNATFSCAETSLFLLIYSFHPLPLPPLLKMGNIPHCTHNWSFPAPSFPHILRWLASFCEMRSHWAVHDTITVFMISHLKRK